MKSVSQVLGKYGAYHRHPLNRMTHYFGLGFRAELYTKVETIAQQLDNKLKSQTSDHSTKL